MQKMATREAALKRINMTANGSLLTATAAISHMKINVIGEKGKQSRRELEQNEIYRDSE